MGTGGTEKSGESLPAVSIASRKSMQPAMSASGASGAVGGMGLLFPSARSCEDAVGG